LLTRDEVRRESFSRGSTNRFHTWSCSIGACGTLFKLWWQPSQRYLRRHFTTSPSGRSEPSQDPHQYLESDHHADSNNDSQNQVSSDASAPRARHGGFLLTFSTSPAVEHPKVGNFTGAQQPAGVYATLRDSLSLQTSDHHENEHANSRSPDLASSGLSTGCPSGSNRES
jgi:hypothetical protein